MLAVGGLPVFNVVVVKFYINCMVAINRCMIVLVLILIYTSLTVNYSYLRIIRLTKAEINNMVGDIISASFSIDMTMSLYLFLDMYLHSGEYHVGTVGIDIRNYIFAVLMR